MEKQQPKKSQLPGSNKPPPAKKKRRTESTQQQKELDQQRQKTRIYLLHMNEKWQNLKKEKKYTHDWELARFLLACHDHLSKAKGPPGISTPGKDLGFVRRGSISTLDMESERDPDSDDLDEDEVNVLVNTTPVCVESRLQVKMNSPDSARAISIKQEEPEDQPHFNIIHMVKEEDSTEQERSSSLLQEEPEPPHIKEEQEEPESPHIKEEQEELLQRPEEPSGSTSMLPAVKSEDISSHRSEIEVELEPDSEDSDDWEETRGGDTEEKPFHCKHCDKSFINSSKLKRQRKTFSM